MNRWPVLVAAVALCVGASQARAQSQTINCSSDDGNRHTCSADTRGGVRLVRQISGSACTQGRTWGYDSSGIWVDRGCRAEFEVLPYAAYAGGSFGSTGVIRCSSDDERRHTCSADTRGGVRLVRQISGSPCTQGRTWGYDSNGIWVDRGCRAEFEVLPYAPYAQGSYGSAGTIRCSSDDERRHTCSADTRGGVRLVRQLSGSPCDQGRSWGYDSNGIWVDRGCRAEFEVLPYAPYAQGSYGSAGTIRCSSDDERRHTCSADTRGGVRLVRQLSGSPCDQGRTWGYDASGIWVDRGCRAEFEVTPVRGGPPYGVAGGYRAGATTLRCSSDDGRRHVCPADTRGRVRILQQLSGSECREGYSWGYDRNGIWVDHGCRGDFEVRSGFRR